MAIKWIAAGEKTELKKSQKTGTAKERFYIDFRQLAYPPYGDDFTYTLIASGANQPGSHNLTGGHGDFLLPLMSTLTIRARFLPTHAFNVATDQCIWSWYYDANNYLKLIYQAADDKYTLAWKDGGTERILQSAAYTADLDLQVWTTIDCAIDLTTGTTAGSAMYVNRAAADTTWSGNIDAKGMEYPKFSLRHLNATEGGYTINHVRIFPNKVATAAQVAADYAGLTEEEVYFSLDGFALGRTRCNVTRHVGRFGYSKNVKDPKSGSESANSLTLTLYSKDGEFADDQYAAYDPTLDQFNGTSAQKYLQTRCRVEAEVWYSNNYDPIFVGQIDDDMFRRRSTRGDISTVDIRAEDIVARIARKYKRRATYFEDKDLSDTTETNSLAHLIARLATQEDIYNFASNSSFENATIGNSWAVAGGTAPTFTKAAGGLFGSNEGQLDYDDGACTVTQTITFTGSKKLNVGESWTFQIWLKSTNACGDQIALFESDAGGDNDSTTANYSIAGGEGWKFYSVTHTITDTASDRLKIQVQLDDNVVLSMDGAMLIQSPRPYYWFVLNNNDGASAVESADDADSDNYDLCGFDCDPVDIQHGWVLINEGDPVWDHLKQLGDAVGSMYLGADESGTFKLRAKLKTGYADPSSLETLTQAQRVASIVESERINKLVGHGVKIVKFSDVKFLWTAAATNLKEVMTDWTISNGDYFPDPENDGGATTRYLAKYGEL